MRVGSCPDGRAAAKRAAARAISCRRKSASRCTKPSAICLSRVHVHSEYSTVQYLQHCTNALRSREWRQRHSRRTGSGAEHHTELCAVAVVLAAVLEISVVERLPVRPPASGTFEYILQYRGRVGRREAHVINESNQMRTLTGGPCRRAHSGRSTPPACRRAIRPDFDQLNCRRDGTEPTSICIAPAVLSYEY